MNALTKQEGALPNVFFPFQAEPLVGRPKHNERPGGAFAWNGRVYVFINISDPFWAKPEDRAALTRPGNPQPGQYLVSTSNPESATPLTTEYLFSPRIGKCILPGSTVRSHHPLGSYFYVRTASEPTRWRRCKWCETLFESISGNPGRCFGDSDGHSPHPRSHVVYEGSYDGPGYQSNWRRCAKCLMMVFNGYASKLRCPAGGNHDLATSPPYSMSFTNTSAEDHARIDDGGWRYCSECQGMVFTRHDNTIGAAVPYVVTAADHSDLPAPPTGASFSGKAVVMISHRFGWTGVRHPGFNLACWHLPAGAGPRLQDLLYFNRVSRTTPSRDQWTPDVEVLGHKNFFDYEYLGHPLPENYYTETGLLWLPGPRRWLLTYTAAQRPNPEVGIPPEAQLRPVYARFAERVTDLDIADDITIFDPNNRPADRALLRDPDGYPYGPYPLERYTTWDPRMGILELHYLLSTYNPYQVQVMRTQIRVP